MSRPTIGDEWNGWAAGTIVALGYKSPDGSFNPYQIRLDSDTLIFAPMDDDRIIRAAK